MNTEPNKKIYRKTIGRAIPINMVCEVGVYLPETSNIIDFIKDGVQTILIEPEPKAIEAIKAYFKGFDNITLYPFAIYDRNGKLTLAKAEASTFAADLPSSPALVNDNYQLDDSKNIEVDCKLFSEIDKGDIDLLSIDTEGCEWYVMATMSSRPKIISIETHGKYYSNPFLKESQKWLNKNDYKVWFKDKSDTVYFKSGLIQMTVSEKISLLAKNVYLWVRKNKRFMLPK